MKSVFAFDYETTLIRPAQAAPPPVCMSWTDRHCPVDEVQLLHAEFDRKQMLDRFEYALDNEVICGANVAYDMAVSMVAEPDLWPKIFAAYEQDRVVDILYAQKLVDIGTSVLVFKQNKANYNLEALARRYLNVDLDKDTWRKLYGRFRKVPLARWVEHAKVVRPHDPDPEGVVRYPKYDGRVTYDVGATIWSQSPPELLVDVQRQTRAAFWINLMVCHGFKTDQRAVAELERKIEKERDEVGYRLRKYGLLRPDGTVNKKAAAERLVEICKAKGIAVKMTDGGESGKQQVALDDDACQMSGDAALRDLSRWGSITSIWNKDIPKLKNPIIQSRFDLADTGRTTCSEGDKVKGKRPALNGFQLQNVRREPGVRECFVPREGCYLLSVDYGQMELHTWAQCCISWVGFSNLAELLNSKLDCHMMFGCRVHSYEDVPHAIKNKKKDPFKDWRQGAKAALFGFPGGLGALSFVEYSRAQWGVIFTLDEAKQLKLNWREMFPEADPYFNYMHSLGTGSDGQGTLVHLFSNRVRSGIYFTERCNGAFQGLAADCAKDAGFQIAKACYVDRSANNPLYGSRVVDFVHDEFILEVPIATSHECANEVVRLMEEAGKRWCPDVPPRAEPALMEKWMKAAEPKYENGRLVPWRPETVSAAA